MKKFIMYGAGNIGRGFIGPTFSQSGYSVGFIDINMEVINRLNADKQYPLDVVCGDSTQEYIISNVYGIDGKNIDLVSDEIASCDVMATAIGVKVLKFIAKPIAEGLKKRYNTNKGPLNIIICENMIGADAYLKGLIKEQIPEYSARIDSEIGFVEASIGRMVPALSEEKRKGNPLRVAVESYNILPVDKDSFKTDMSDIKNLYPYSPFNLFIERKLYMHNMSHALTAYLGNIKGYEFIYQAIADCDIRYAVLRALVQSAQAVAKENGAEIGFLLSHAENLLYRFTNEALGDTVIRVGKDTVRKLGSNDRLIGAIKLCEKHSLSCEYLCVGVASGMYFAPESDHSSIELKAFANENGAIKTLQKYSDYNGKNLKLIETFYSMLGEGKTVKDVIDYCDMVSGREIRV